MIIWIRIHHKIGLDSQHCLLQVPQVCLVCWLDRHVLRYDPCDDHELLWLDRWWINISTRESQSSYLVFSSSTRFVLLSTEPVSLFYTVYCTYWYIKKLLNLFQTCTVLLRLQSDCFIKGGNRKNGTAHKKAISIRLPWFMLQKFKIQI